jgi:predicted  nucleic acid-binding Zn-ribbon protein
MTLVVLAPAATPVYRCTECDARWAYGDVRHIARCRDCGGGLVRATEATPDQKASRSG